MHASDPQLQAEAPARRPRHKRFYERFETPRLTVLRAASKRPHRYRAYRGLTMLASIALLLAVPLLGVARLDLYGGAHRMLFREAAPLYGFIAVSVAIFSFYFLTFNVNMVAGRMFCGWGCPVGQLNRLTDTLRASRGWKAKLLWGAALLGFAGALAFAVELWWTSATVFTVWPWSLVAVAAFAAVTGGLIAAARLIGWSFCMKACPIGLYYSVVQQKRPLGILFEKSNCLEEGACVKACPVALDPRDMLELRAGIGGLAIDGLAANNHCLRCGECVEACEIATSKVSKPALFFGRPPAPLELPARAELVQLPTRASAPLPLPRLLEAEPEAPALPWRERLFTGGEKGLWGSGLSPASLAAGLSILGLVFLLAGGPLWQVATGTSMVPRLLAAAASAPVLAAMGLLLQRRLGVPRLLGASGLMLSGGALVVSLLFLAASPGSASVYHPKQTWKTEPEQQEVRKNGKHYQPAAEGFAAGAISGVVRGPGAAHALVFLEHPLPGLPARGASEQLLRFERQGLGQALWAIGAGDKLLVENATPELHTLTLSQRGRGVRNVPLPANTGGKSIAAPAAGEYELSCANHPTERGLLLVFDHPYYAWTDEQGGFRMEGAPAGEAELVVAADPRRRAQQKVQVLAGQVSPGTLELQEN